MTNKLTNSKQYPLVSIITPAYNRAGLIEETILSVLDQSYPNIEYIVIDDGSTDNTLEIIKKYEDKLILITQDNIGETKTVNRGFRLSNGALIAVVNSDDPLLPGAVSTVVTYMENNPDALVAYPDWNEIDINSNVIKTMHLPEYDIFSMLEEFNVSLGLGTFIRSRALESYGLRDPSFKYSGDIEYWFRLASYGKLLHIPEVLATHRVHPEAASSSQKSAEMGNEAVRAIRKLFYRQDLPKNVLKLQSIAMSNAHLSAKNYCGSDILAKVRHLVSFIFFDPLYSIPKTLEILFFWFVKFFKNKIRH